MAETRDEQPGKRPAHCRCCFPALRLVVYIAALALAVVARNVLLLGFAAVLIAVLINAVISRGARFLHLPRWLGMILLFILVVGVGGLSLWLLAGPLIEQTQTLLDRLPAAFDQLMARLKGWFPGMMGNGQGNGNGNGGPALGQMLGWTRQALSVTLTVGTGLAVLAVITSYLAVEPGSYRHGILLLVPDRWRETADRLIVRLHHDLDSWLLGKFLSMIFVIIMTVVGLLILGIPAAIVLGLIAGVLTFVPNFGPITSAIPALLLALGDGGLDLALWVAGLYVLTQLLEGYLVTPLIQRRVVSLPPALLLFGQTLAAVLMGPLGLILAAPLTVMIKSTVLELYVGDDQDTQQAGDTTTEADRAAEDDSAA